MSLTADQVKYIAKLARLKLSDNEVTKFSTQLTGVLDYIEVLNELDTSNISETHQITGLKNIMRSDQVNQYEDIGELLECSKLIKEDNQIKVKKVI